MKTFSQIFVAVALFASVHSQQSSTPQTSTTPLVCDHDPFVELPPCPGWEEGTPTYWPFPYDCRRFIECTNGFAKVQCCPTGTVWDQDLTVCNHESFTPCMTVTTGAPTTT